MARSGLVVAHLRIEAMDWRVGRRRLAGTGIMTILASPGIAFLIPPFGIFLALVAFMVGIGLLFQSAVWMSGPCPFCHAVQTVWVPTEACRWKRVRRRSTGYVLGADCGVCRNRLILRVDDRIALPAPRVVAGRVTGGS